MPERKECLFQLIRYVPQIWRGEFVNIGVLLHAPAEQQPLLRFTRDWRRLRCLDPDADFRYLENLESEIGERLRMHQVPSDSSNTGPPPIIPYLEQMLSNNVLLTEAKAHWADSIPSGLEQLMSLHVDMPRRERTTRRGARAELLGEMRSQFEAAGVWGLMRKGIAVSDYTRPGDPLRIDCGYRNGFLKMFQAVSLDANAIDSKVLAFAAPALFQGVKAQEGADLLLTAIIEPIGWPQAGETGQEGAELDADRIALYDYARDTMTAHGIQVMTTSDLPRLAQAARADLHV